MARVGAALMGASMFLAACATRGAPATHAPASAPSLQARNDCPRSAEPASPWREMTWAEYYADVRERASRRGVEVIWITPPDVRPAHKAESSAAPLAACAR